MTANQRRVLRWTIPVDDQWHQIGGGKVVYVGSRNRSDAVEVWTVEATPEDWPRRPVSTPQRTVRVYGTGQVIHDRDSEHIGSTVAAGNIFVWHVFASLDPA